ncbi:MAG: glycerol-3-phosphate 1-O-acyltransferase PlsY [Acidimicrobiia bacterium]|nr:glycerol-3-phosphate 1-O-acyltransferase PlsY [Acidimicrobiia bacterium]
MPPATWVSFSAVMGYLVGSIPFALVLARRWGAGDLRLVGSGNVGAANVARASGLKSGLVVALLDISKGIVSVLLAERLFGGANAAAAAGVAAVVGHVYPVWLGFRGGKGVATACGAFVILAPIAAGAALASFVVCVWATRYVSLGSVVASLMVPVLAWSSDEPLPVFTAGISCAALIIFRHRENLRRMLTGTERRFGRVER